MTQWWRLWEGIITEYWDGEWRLGAKDLGGDLAIALVVPVEDHLLVAMDHSLLRFLADEQDLVVMSDALRRLVSYDQLNTPGLFAALPMTVELKGRISEASTLHRYTGRRRS
ncbi:MAG: hypothetical protein M1272_01880 [Firmicutes bacterium]|nr:hypothetical protein [Bacillota bacterium]